MSVKSILAKFTIKEKILIPVVLVGGLWLGFHPTPSQPPSVSHPLPNIERVEVPNITEKVVKEFIQDPAQLALINAQAAQIKHLKGDVIELTSSLASARSTGGLGLNGGTITTVSNVSSVSPSEVPSTSQPSREDHAFQFKDYQLTALYTSTGSKFTYGLQQEFTITTTTGKDRAGHRTTLVDLSQKTPSGLVSIPTTTVEFFASENPVKWFKSPRIQGGVAVDSTGAKSGLVALQWLRRGTSSAAEDTRFSLMSPAIGSRGLTLLPVSVNLGPTIKHNPLTNIWISPTINLDKSVGLAITATF